MYSSADYSHLSVQGLIYFLHMMGLTLVLTDLPGTAGASIKKQPPAETLQNAKHLWMNISCPNITKHL